MIFPRLRDPGGESRNLGKTFLSDSLNIQTADIGWPTGNGNKLSNSQAYCLA